MQAVYKDLNCNTASDMSELNVMDFVETEFNSEDHGDVTLENNVMNFVKTEYKSDDHEVISLENESNRNQQRKSKLFASYEFDDFEDGAKISFSPLSSKKCLQRKRRRSSATSRSFHDDSLYPYATLLQMLCDEVGTKNFVQEPRTEKVFKQLGHANLCYPYATFLQELHEIAKNDFDSASSKDDDHANLSESEVSRVMRNFRFKTNTLKPDFSENSENSGKDVFEKKFSTLLLDLVNEHNLQDQSYLDVRPVHGVGKILKGCMSDVPGTKPVEELSCSALLQQLSLLAKRENDSEIETVTQILIESSDSSVEEEKEWKPTSCIQRDGAPDEVQREPRKRKSMRRKKPVSRFDATPEKSKQRMQSNRYRTIWQLILGKGNDTRNKKVNDSSLRSEVLEKIKDKINNRKVFPASNSNSYENVSHTGNEESFSDGSMEEENIFNSRREKSLLKEYLLKPTDTEITTRSNANMPIMSESSFLFSRLLQKFKMASSNSYTVSNDHCMEEDLGSSMLRKMLIEKGNSLPNFSNDNEVQDGKDFKPLQLLDLTSLQSFLRENDSELPPVYSIKEEVESDDDGLGEKLRERLSRDLHKSENNSTLDIANHQDISTEGNCSNEPKNFNPVCKIKCEVKCEDEYFDAVHQCDACHAQFSSSIDLADHELLFHGSNNKEPQTPGTACVLPHSSDILQKGLFQEKLPA